jgi:putative transposase
MQNYRRVESEGGAFFFTVVTDRRQKLQILPNCRQALRNAIAEVKQNHPFHDQSAEEILK